MKLGELADRIGGRISGSPDIEITGVSGINEAKQGDISFLGDKKNLRYALTSNASALIVKEEIKGLSGREHQRPVSMLIVDNPLPNPPASATGPLSATM